MTGKSPEKSLKEAKAEEREARLAEALRANLRRRKGQKKLRAVVAPDPEDVDEEGGPEEGGNERT